MKQPTTATMSFGVIVFLASLGAWLWGETHGVNTDILWIVTTPVVGALFIGQQLGATAQHAQQAANQTNGMMDSRVKSAVSAALADRDAARTRQAQGDVSDATTAATSSSSPPATLG